MTGATHVLGWISVATQGGAKSGAIWSWWWLWLTLVVISIALLGIVAMIGRRRRMAGLLGGRPRQRRAIKDPWVEAGRRAEPLPIEDEDGDPEDRPEGGS